MRGAVLPPLHWPAAVKAVELALADYFPGDMGQFIQRNLTATVLAGSSHMPKWAGLILFEMIAIPVSILGLFLMYWLLPNRKIAPVRMIPVAILVGLVLELLKYVNLLTWPMLKAKLLNEYGPFYMSVSVVLWSFVPAMVVLPGAERSARNGRSAILK